MKNFTFLFSLLLLFVFTSCEKEDEAVLPNLDGVYDVTMVTNINTYTNGVQTASTQEQDAFSVTIYGNEFSQSTKNDATLACAGDITITSDNVRFHDSDCNGTSIRGFLRYDTERQRIFRRTFVDNRPHQNGGNCSQGCNDEASANRGTYTTEDRMVEMVLR